MTSDPEFTFQVNKISKGELQSVEDIAVGHNFRNWCKKLVEAAGVDSKESAIVFNEDFNVPSMDTWADFIAAAALTYMGAGNEIALPGHDDIVPMSISIQKVKEQKKVRDGRLRFVFQKGIGEVMTFGEETYARCVSEEEIRAVLMDNTVL